MKAVISGRVLAVTEKKGKSEKDPYHVVQILQNGKGRASLVDVAFFGKGAPKINEEISLDCIIAPYQSAKTGFLGLNCAHYAEA